MVALAAAQQPEEVLRHPREVVRRPPAHGVRRRAVGADLQRRDFVDVRLERVVVDGHVQAVVGHVLAQRHHPAVKHAPETAVTMKVPLDVEVMQERGGIGDRRLGRARGAGRVGALEAGLQRGRFVAGGGLRLHGSMRAARLAAAVDPIIADVRHACPRSSRA